MGLVSAVVEDVVLEHAMRATTLWDQRERLVNGRVHDLESLVDLDRELSAHLAALVLAGAAGWEIAEQAWGWAARPEAFAGLVVAVRLGNRSHIEHVVASCDRPEQLPGLVSALGWLPFERVKPLLDDWADYDGPRWRALALAGYVAHRHDPGRVVDRGLIHGDVDVRQQAVRAAGFLNRRELVPVLVSMVSEQKGAEVVVARALHQLRGPGAAEILFACAKQEGARGEQAAEIAVRQLEPEVVVSWIEWLASRPGTERQVVAAAGASGLPEAMRWLLPAMDDPETALLAGQGFTTLTGVDLEDADLLDDSREIDDALVEPTELGLPWPDPAKIEAWWSRRRGSFAKARRWRQGRPQTIRGIREALVSGSQHERTLAAHDLLLMHRSHAVPFETHAPAWRQCRWLMPLRELVRGTR